MHVQKKFQIFVSSTSKDLENERRAVIEAIINMRHIPIGMEAFEAGNKEQWEYIKQRIDESDYYVVLVAERYGSEKDGVSYTEMEYDYAREKKVPVAAFLLAEEARKDWRAQKSDFIDNRQKVDAFRDKCQGRMVRYWKNKDDLAAACVMSLLKMFHDDPRDGWIPAKQAANPDVANELARLSEENKDLREKLKGLDIDIETDKSIRCLHSNCLEYQNGDVISFYKIFLSLKTILLNGLSLRKAVGGNIFIHLQAKLDEEISLEFDEYGFRITEFFNFLLLHNIIQENRIVKRQREGYDSVYTSYVLTDFGKRVVRRIIQMREEQAEPA
jgi:hypothetical protein